MSASVSPADRATDSSGESMARTLPVSEGLRAPLGAGGSLRRVPMVRTSVAWSGTSAGPEDRAIPIRDWNTGKGERCSIRPTPELPLGNHGRRPPRVPARGPGTARLVEAGGIEPPSVSPRQQDLRT